MDEREPSPLPPLPIGDTLGVPGASPDVLRQILRRHRRRQTALGAAGLVAVLVAGSLGGWAVGRSDRSNGRGIRVAAGGPASAAQAAAAAAPLPHGPVPVSGVATSGSAPVGTMITPQSTHLLVRDAADGTRVRLYEQSFGVPKVACGAGQTCPPMMLPPCMPTSNVMAEVSDDQVAGETAGPMWHTASSGAIDPVSEDVIGAGQLQPILVVTARTQAPTAKVSLSTAYGSDEETPAANGWVALAVRLPADFATDPSTGLPAGKVVASDAGGNAVSSNALTRAVPIAPPCAPGPCVGQVPPPSPPAADASTTAPLTSEATTAPAHATASGCACVPSTTTPPAGSGATNQATVACAAISFGGSGSGSGTGSVSVSSGSGAASSGSGGASSGPASTIP